MPVNMIGETYHIIASELSAVGNRLDSDFRCEMTVIAC